MTPSVHAQDFERIDGASEQVTGNKNNNFNPHNNDTTSSAQIVPKGIYVWTVDRKFGDIRKAEVDTLPHLYPQSTTGTGMYGEYNTTGSNFTTRQSRIFANRPLTSQFFFTDCYDQTLRQPDQWHFTNTLSPITNLSYDNCGDKTNGEDHLEARFAVNANKKTGFGFDLNYQYARGFFQNQSISHFGATVYVSHLGDQYQMHALYSTNHEKAGENGGITNDEYIVHPEIYSESFSENEIPTVLERNWNRNNNRHLFLTHRYAIGFFRKVPLTEEELKARQFAMTDSAMNAMTPEDSLEATMKREFVPVTSFIHTAELNSYDHIYQAYQSPANYYADTYYTLSAHGGYQGDSIYDKTKYLQLKNTLAIALLEGFNKYAPAGLKGFVTHEMRRFDMPDIDEENITYLRRYNEHNVSLGGQLQKAQGQTLHYNALLEAWIAGEDAGQLKLDASADLNFRLFNDTLRLMANGYFYRLNPTFLQRQYHSKHLWWDNSSFDKETRTRIEGSLAFEKTNTRLRVAIEEIQNYTYLGMDYTLNGEERQGLTANFLQHSGNINILTAQLDQRMRLGPLHWDNLITYQSSSNEDVLPLPTLNIFTNLYLDFMIAHVLKVELGASATWFTKYYAPDYCPLLNQFAVQKNETARVKIGEFPFIDVYANLHLKHARFFLMMSNATGTSFSRQTFLTPHYPLNRSTLHFGISWNFFN